MANLTVDREDLRQDGVLVSYPIAAATKLFKGSIVTTNAAGHAVKGADTAAFFLAGIAYEQVDNTGAAAAKTIRVWRKGIVELNFSGTAAQADLGKEVFVVDDNTVGLAATTTNDVRVGCITEFVSASKVRVELSAA